MMSRLLRRIQRGRRVAAADEHHPSPTPHAPVDAAHDASDTSGSGFVLPAGEDPSDGRPTALRRGRLRKRVRFLERERELLLRDLGGLVFEIHRTGGPTDREHQRQLVSAKVERLSTVDGQLSAGRASLGEPSGDMVLREPGVGGLCPRCGEIFGSDARFCSACGTPVIGRAAADRAPTPTDSSLRLAASADPVVAPPDPAPRGFRRFETGAHELHEPAPPEPPTEIVRATREQPAQAPADDTPSSGSPGPQAR